MNQLKIMNKTLCFFCFWPSISQFKSLPNSLNLNEHLDHSAISFQFQIQINCEIHKTNKEPKIIRMSFLVDKAKVVLHETRNRASTFGVFVTNNVIKAKLMAENVYLKERIRLRQVIEFWELHLNFKLPVNMNDLLLNVLSFVFFFFFLDVSFIFGLTLCFFLKSNTRCIWLISKYFNFI